jgi:hypothetical protein
MTSADVIRELRAARPVADDALRARVRAIGAGEPTRRASPLARFSGWRRGALVALPAAAVLAAATAGAIGLARSDGTNDRLAAQSPTTDSALEKAAPQSQAAPRAGVASPQAGSAPGPASDRAQRFSATLTLEVPDTDALSDATQQALRTTRQLGGYAVNVSYASGDSGAASMTLRVPTSRAQEAIARLSQLGTIVDQQVQVDDLQESLDELHARQAALRSRIARLTAELRATDLDPVRRATLEAQRRAARAELAGVTASAGSTVRDASLATMQLTLRTKEQSAVPAGPSRLHRGLDRAVAVLAWEGVALLFAAIVAGPFLAAVFAAGAWRRQRRLRGEAELLASH